TLYEEREPIEHLENLAEIVGMRLSRLSGIPGDQNVIHWVCPIERSVIFGKGEDGAEHRLDMLQRSFRKIPLFRDCAYHSISVHRAEFSQAKLPDMVAKVIDPDFAMPLAGAGAALFLGPRQVSSFDKGG